ncbi:DUF7018 domain-containing (lipo)protein [Bacillus cereus]|uniref:DUF7018 domain-containing (lipo)protein n=1 Tax=Bacillus cereus TaxID=1396 RepID=UPI003D16DFEE
MKRKVLAVVVPVMLFSSVGCVGDWIFEKDRDKVVQSVESKVEKKDKKSEEIYPDKLSRLRDNVEVSVMDLKEVFFDYETLRKEEVDEKISTFKDTTNKLRKLKPSEGYEDVQKEVVKSVDNLDRGLRDRLEGMEKKDSKLIEKAKKTMSDAQEQLHEALRQANMVQLQKSKQTWG